MFKWVCIFSFIYANNLSAQTIDIAPITIKKTKDFIVTG